MKARRRAASYWESSLSKELTHERGKTDGIIAISIRRRLKYCAKTSTLLPLSEIGGSPCGRQRDEWKLRGRWRWRMLDRRRHGARNKKGERNRERREKEATARTPPTFDLFKWADRLSHEGAICFFLESFSYTPNPILSPRLFLFFPLPRSISNGFHTAIFNVKKIIFNKF